jgi:hypothetical protein
MTATSNSLAAKFIFENYKRAELYFKDFEPSILEEVATVADLTPGNIVNIRKAYILESIFKDIEKEEDKKLILTDLINREVILQKSSRSPIGFLQ